MGNIAASEDQAPHTTYRYQRSYFRRGGTLQVPVAGQPGQDGTSEVCQWATPFSFVVVQWVAERINDLPVVPDYVSSDPNEVFCDMVLGVVTPNLLPDGVTWVYSLSGAYYYHLLKPVSRTSTFKLGGPPFATTPPTKTVTVAQLRRVI